MNENTINFQAGPREQGDGMKIAIISSASVDSGDEDIATVDNKDHVFEDHIAMDEVELQPTPKTVDIPPNEVV